MKKLFLHIGLHKTGTTSIQRTLNQNKIALNNQGFGYFCQMPNGQVNKGGSTGSWMRSKHIQPEFGFEIKNSSKLAKKLNDLPFKSIIMSTEAFSWVFDSDQIRKLSNALKEYFDVEVIVYLRRQDKLAVSHFQQASKKRNHQSYRYYGGGCLALPSRTGEYEGYFDYFTRLSMWIDAFGIDKIKCRVFDKAELVRGDVVSDFLNLVGIESDQIRLVRVNESYGYERTKIGHLINDSNLVGPVSKIIRQATDNSGKNLPSRADAKEFYEKYRDSNIELNRQLKISSLYEDIFGDDFNSYPEKASELWTEDSANQAITNILQSLKCFDNIEVKTLTETAIAIEDDNLELSAQLMSLAHILNPGGFLIKKKIEEYKAKLG